MLEDILRRMRDHTRQNPTHGHNCSCKDDMVREFDRILRAEEGLVREFSLVARYLS